MGATRLVVSPFCPNGVHRHDGPDGLRVPGCKVSRRYEVRDFGAGGVCAADAAPAGFQAEQVQRRAADRPGPKFEGSIATEAIL